MYPEDVNDEYVVHEWIENLQDLDRYDETTVAEQHDAVKYYLRHRTDEE